MKFYVGLHQPSDAMHFDAACISINRLRKRKKYVECDDVIIDSGAFTELNIHGHYRHSVVDYALDLYRLYINGIVNITGAVSQDYMCEPFILEKTGLDIETHQRLTIERYDLLKFTLDQLFGGVCPFKIIPVLQGFSPMDYVNHLFSYGERLKNGMWVGVGSICKRQGNPNSIIDLLTYISLVRPDLELHGFGVKKTALNNEKIRSLLNTADSMAWSFQARIEGRDPNDWKEAKAFSNKIKGMSNA